jgi:hypothetical protein
MVAQPVARDCGRGLDAPLARRDARLSRDGRLHRLGDLRSTHRAGDVVLVREDEHGTSVAHQRFLLYDAVQLAAHAAAGLTGLRRPRILRQRRPPIPEQAECRDWEEEILRLLCERDKYTATVGGTGKKRKKKEEKKRKKKTRPNLLRANTSCE